MKILLLWLQLGSQQKQSVHHGLASIAGYLGSKGHVIMCQSIVDESDMDNVHKSILSDTPGLIGISLTSNQRRYLDSCTESIRVHFKGLIIAGGVHATLEPEDVLKCSAIDGVCVGDGEYPLGILIEHIENRTAYLNTPSFFWKNKNVENLKIVKNSLYPLINDLSELPLPDYSLFEIEKINSQFGGFASVILSRGCPYNCTYCCNKAIKSVVAGSGKYFRILPVEGALQLLEDYVNRYQVTKGFFFEDDLMLLDKRWFNKFATEYKNRIGLPYICNGRFELLQSETFVRILKETGCYMVNLGLESGDEEFRQKVLKRKYSNNDVYNAVKLLKKFDISFFTYNIFGFPLETKQQMHNTISLNMKIKPHSGQVFFFYPYPKTELYNICVENNLLIPERMAEVSGYKEKTVIKMINCTEKDCIKAYQQLTLYFMARRLSNFLKYNHVLVDRFVYSIMLIFPLFFVKIFTKKNPIKQILRKVFYMRLGK